MVDVLWSPRFWFGETNLSWEDFEGVNNDSYDLLYPMPVSILILLTRGMFVNFVFEKLGLKQRVDKKSFANGKLENVYREGKGAPKDLTIKKAVESGMSERQAERWLRKRTESDKPTKKEKLVETTMRASYYLSTCIYGMLILYSKDWLWDTRYCWYQYPRHHIEDEVRRYYMIQLTFYWFLTFSQLYGDSTKKRKDFWQMMLHHAASISLIYFSWVLNMVRAGMLVLVLHDMADVLLELAKMCKYANWQKMCNLTFAIFVVTWIVTRLYIYPKYVVYTTVYESAEILFPTNFVPPVYYVMNTFMILLLVLHVIWTYYIIKALIKALNSTGNIEKDERSSSSE